MSKPAINGLSACTRDRYDELDDLHVDYPDDPEVPDYPVTATVAGPRTVSPQCYAQVLHQLGKTIRRYERDVNTLTRIHVSVQSRSRRTGPGLSTRWPQRPRTRVPCYSERRHVQPRSSSGLPSPFPHALLPTVHSTWHGRSASRFLILSAWIPSCLSRVQLPGHDMKPVHRALACSVGSRMKRNPSCPTSPIRSHRIAVALPFWSSQSALPFWRRQPLTRGGRDF